MLLKLAVGVIVAYGGIVGALYLTQRSLLYLPGLARVSPAAAGLPQAEEVTLTTADTERLVAWHVAPRSDRPIMLYLQALLSGNYLKRFNWLESTESRFCRAISLSS
jgi:uncharacterized protein